MRRRTLKRKMKALEGRLKTLEKQAAPRHDHLHDLHHQIDKLEKRFRGAAHHAGMGA